MAMVMVVIGCRFIVIVMMVMGMAMIVSLMKMMDVNHVLRRIVMNLMQARHNGC